MTTNAICVFDFTASEQFNDEITIKTALNKYCKAWCFQLEEGSETGYKHFQGRFSLITKSRKGNIPGINARYSPTSSPSSTNFDYVMKEDTRIAGPWSDRDSPAYIPRQFRGKLETLLPFQKTIMEECKVFNDRIINKIYCPGGGRGKSTIAHLMRLFKNGLVLPPLNDADRLVYTCCDKLMAKKIRDSIPIFIDLPRAMNKERLFGLYSAIEVIKSGYVYDTRNRYREWDFDSPNIWVFSNIEPDLSLLSRDRWRLWEINDKDELVEFRGTSCNNINSTTPAHLAHFENFSIDNDDL